MIRTRFAPSPTGYLHVGGIRTALFAFLVARQAGGTFVLRLEDTDKAREVTGSAEHLIASLTSLGLTYDEGPDIGGQFGPYKQSERLEIYKAWAGKLIEQGRAYADPYSTEEIQTFREQAQAEKRGGTSSDIGIIGLGSDWLSARRRMSRAFSSGKGVKPPSASKSRCKTSMM